MQLRTHVGQAFLLKNLEFVNSAVSIGLTQVSAGFEYD